MSNWREFLGYYVVTMGSIFVIVYCIAWVANWWPA